MITKNSLCYDAAPVATAHTGDVMAKLSMIIHRYCRCCSALLSSDSLSDLAG